MMLVLLELYGMLKIKGHIFIEFFTPGNGLRTQIETSETMYTKIHFLYKKYQMKHTKSTSFAEVIHLV